MTLLTIVQMNKFLVTKVEGVALVLTASISVVR